MLRRAARRRGPRDPFRHPTQSSQQLYLPWLCPAQLRWQGTTAAAAAPAQFPEAKRSKPAWSVTKRTDTRSLATAAGEFATSQYDPIPFAGALSSEAARRDPPMLPFLDNLTFPNPSQPLIVKHLAVATPSPPLNPKRDMIKGQVPDLIQNVHACLLVGRFSRAKAIMRRLGEVLHTNEAEILSLHQRCIEALVDAALRKQWDVTWRDIQRWFEIEVRAHALKPDLAMYTTVLRFGMASLDGAARERIVRRYLHQAEQDDPAIYRELISSGIVTNPGKDSARALQIDDISSPLPTVESSSIDTESLSTTSTDSLSRHTPEVRPVIQKGLGLKTLRTSLNAFYNPHEIPYPHEMAGTKEEKDKAWAYMRQLRIEEDVFHASVDRWRREVEQMQKLGVSSAVQGKTIEALFWQWHTALVPLVEEELRAVREAQNAEDLVNDTTTWNRLSYGPFLESMTAEAIAAVAIITTLQELSRRDRDAATVVQVTDRIGKTLQKESAQQAEEQRRRIKLRGFTDSQRGNTASELLRRLKQTEWPATVKQHIGAFLLAKILEITKIRIGDSELGPLEPAMLHKIVTRRGKRVGVIIAHEALLERLSRDPTRFILGAQLPMLVEPKPWTGFNEGGFLTRRNPVIRQASPDEAQRLYILAATEKGDLKQVYAALDVLGKTPWRINPRTLDVMLEVWNTGEQLGKIVPECPQIDYPPEPEPSADPQVRKAWEKKVASLNSFKMGLHSQRCFQNFQLEVARAYRDEVFYYPHNLDFRGRAYPIPPYLNHLGADHARGLLMFGVGKELGTAGLKWLKVQLANLFGFDKASLKEREEFTMQHIDDIYDSATNPLTGRRWWQQAEDPWQCLAACFDLKAALDSPDPSRYISYLPVHQDGTCNGLQHYAALGGDVVGASQVNLVPGDRPADIYSAVAEAVLAEVKADAEQGNAMALLLDGKIKRKVVKQPVMTNVYGVTVVGAIAQVKRQLQEMMPEFEETPDMRWHQLSAYIVRKLFRALSSMFQGAHDIQTWFAECALRISMALTAEQIERVRAIMEQQASTRTERGKQKRNPKGIDVLEEIMKFKSPVIWTTPLKLPVVQPYREAKPVTALTVLQKINLNCPDVTHPVSKRRHVQGFPPNFVHSLDATHMMLSALKCHELGLTFASVHDSYWTHAADVPTMNGILRDAFIRMHSEDIIGRLAAEFNARYKDCLYSASVRRKSRAGQRIMALRKQQYGDAKKNRSPTWGAAWEVTQEAERQRLLRSEDPEERKRGEEMVTPASIFLADPDTSASLVPEDDIKPNPLGEIPESIDTKQATDSLYDVSEDPFDTNTETDVYDETENAATDDDEMFAETNSETDMNDEPEKAPIETNSDADVHEEPGEPPSKAAKRAKRARYPAKTRIWLPLTFPPVPKRGDFDVSKLRDSQYFFS